MGKRLGRKRLYSLNKQGQTYSTSTPGSAVSASIGHSKVMRHGTEIITEIYVDLAAQAGAWTSTGASLSGSIMGVSSSLPTVAVQSAPAYLTKLSTDNNGVINLMEINCIETPVGGTTDINLLAATASLPWSGSGGLANKSDLFTCINAGTAVIGSAAAAAIDGNQLATYNYLYLGSGAAVTSRSQPPYTAGKFIIRLFGMAVPADVDNT